MHIAPDLKTAIDERIDRSGETQVAVVDFDNTCIENDIAEAVLAHMCERRLIRDRSLLPPGIASDTDYNQQVFRQYYSLLSEGDFRSAYKLCAKVFAGYTPDQASAIVRSAIRAEGQVIGKRELFGISIHRGLRARPATHDLLKYLTKCGVEIWIVSASPEIAVKSAMQHFHISGNLIAVTAKLSNGVLLNALNEPYPIAEMKVDCIKHFIHRTKSPLLAIGDSMNDFAMLNYAQLRVVIDRGNDLVHEAEQRGWFIVSSGRGTSEPNFPLRSTQA